MPLLGFMTYECIIFASFFYFWFQTSFSIFASVRLFIFNPKFSLDVLFSRLFWPVFIYFSILRKQDEAAFEPRTLQVLDDVLTHGALYENKVINLVYLMAPTLSCNYHKLVNKDYSTDLFYDNQIVIGRAVFFNRAIPGRFSCLFSVYSKEIYNDKMWKYPSSIRC